MTIRVHIERLVLDEALLARADAPALAAAVAQRLTALLTATGLHPNLAAGGAVAGVDGGAITGPPAGPDALGAQVADALHAGLGAPASSVDRATWRTR